MSEAAGGDNDAIGGFLKRLEGLAKHGKKEVPAETELYAFADARFLEAGFPRAATIVPATWRAPSVE